MKRKSYYQLGRIFVALGLSLFLIDVFISGLLNPWMNGLITVLMIATLTFGLVVELLNYFKRDK